MVENRPTRDFGIRLSIALDLVDATPQELASALTRAQYAPASRKQVGIKRGAIQAWIQGKSRRIPSEAIPYLSKLLDQTEAFFYGLQDTPNWKPQRNFKRSQRSSVSCEDLGDLLGFTPKLRGANGRI